LRWFRGEPRAAAGPKPRGPAPFDVYGRLTGLPEDAVIGAGYAPGFAPDLTCWRLFVSSSGHVRQEVRLSVADNHYRPEERAEEGGVSPEVAAALVTAAEAAGVREMAGWYESDCTDEEAISVAVRWPGGVVSVGAYGPWTLVSRGNWEVVALLGLWMAVQRVAPWHPPWWSRRPEPGAAPARHRPDSRRSFGPAPA
jgi:hypothetical protein